MYLLIEILGPHCGYQSTAMSKFKMAKKTTTLHQAAS